LKLAIVGGALQGMEAVYLSKKAGYSTVVIDRRKEAPAGYLADRFEHCDVVKEPEKAKEIFSKCDAVIPAVEELDALETLDRIVPECGIPFLFDLESYRTSCSKEKSNELMASIGVPLPQPWPECGFPIIVKPSSQSGSIGVSVANNEEERQKGLKAIEKLGDTPIQQEFVSGKSVSVEVIGNGKTARGYITTEVVLDYNYDCKQVICEPGILSPEEDRQFAQIGADIGARLGLKALMDVEAIRTKKGLRVLEIDARIPSQTPAAICAATGINLLEELVCSAMGKESGKVSTGKCSIYEHYHILNGALFTCGEKEFGHVTRPYLDRDFFGADEAITDYSPDKSEWWATIINHGDTMSEVLAKRREFITNVMRDLELEEFIDKSPEML